MVYLIGKWDQKSIILKFGQFNHLIILDKLIWTCPTWLVVFFTDHQMIIWFVKLDKKKLGSQKNLIKKNNSILKYKNVINK